MTKRLLLLTLGLFSFPTLRAQQNVGLLLGLGTDAPPQYRTMWITVVDGKISLAAEFNDLLVPRKAGFWRVGVDNPCSDTNFENEVRGGPVENPWPAIDCKNRPESANEFATSLTFVSSDYVAEKVTESFAANHIPAAYFLTFSSLDHLGRPPNKAGSVAFTTIFGPNSTKAFEEAILGAEAKDRAQGAKCTKTASLESSSWAVRHWQDRWIPTGWSPMDDQCGGGLDYRIPLDVPASVAAPWKLPTPWDELVRQIPTARSAVVSPDGHVVVVLTSAKVMVFMIQNGQVASKGVEVASVRNAQTCSRLGECEEVVMTEWALGKHVRHWTDEIHTYTLAVGCQREATTFTNVGPKQRRET
jgi:hypothetical protein